MGVNAAVVGILISAFYQPIWSSSILAPVDFALAPYYLVCSCFGSTPLDYCRYWCYRRIVHYIILRDKVKLPSMGVLQPL